jgi:hypothetical protein
VDPLRGPLILGVRLAQRIRRCRSARESAKGERRQRIIDGRDGEPRGVPTRCSDPTTGHKDRLRNMIRRPRLRLTVRHIMGMVAIAGIVLAFGIFLLVDNDPVDLLLAAISRLGGDFTVYSNGYSESRFRSVRRGMAVHDVAEIMGPPLEMGKWQVPGGRGPITPEEGVLDDIWFYSRAGQPMGNYWRREVWFRNGTVYRTEGGFYVD